MSEGPSCASCGAVMASDQQDCLECGTKRTPAARAAWKAPLLAAALAVLIAAILLVLAYRQLREDAEEGAGHSATPAPGLTPTPSATPNASAAPLPPPAAPLAAAAPSR